MINEEGPLSPAGEGASTASGENGDDFFSSWDKPTIKRPSNPPSRTGTPPVVSRTGSPFLSAGNANGAARSKSPSPLVAAAQDAENNLPAPKAVRSTPAAAVRRPAGATAGAKRGNILGAKKTTKLGAKKIGAATEDIDFDAAEKAAKAEAERIEKLGYDPEAEAAETKAKSGSIVDTPAVTSTAPMSPSGTRSASGSQQQHQRSASEVERLGMGVARLGFGQVGRSASGGGSGSGSTAPAPKKMGFGSIGASKPAPPEGKYQPPLFIFNITPKPISNFPLL